MTHSSSTASVQEVPRLDQIKRYLFVVNPIAGKGAQDGFQSLIEDYSSLYKWEYELYKTTGTQDADHIRSLIKNFKPQAVIAVGGDGTVSLVAEILAGTELILGIVPAGSGNGFSKDIKLPQNNQQQALDSLLHGRVEKIDTLEANNHFFMHLADVGFNAHIVKLYDNSNSRGLSTYARFVFREFFKYPSHYYEVETDNGSYRGRAFMITIANSRQFGSNLTINPEGNWSDGKFEVVIIRRFPKKQVLHFFWRLLTKKIQFSPYSIILKCSRAKIRCQHQRTLQYDGEVAGKVKEVQVSIKKQNLNIIIP